MQSSFFPLQRCWRGITHRALCFQLRLNFKSNNQFTNEGLTKMWVVMGNASLGELLWVVQTGLEPKGEIFICLEKLELARNPFLVVDLQCDSYRAGWAGTNRDFVLTPRLTAPLFVGHWNTFPIHFLCLLYYCFKITFPLIGSGERACSFAFNFSFFFSHKLVRKKIAEYVN